MNFIEALEEMKKGKIVKCEKNKVRYKIKDNILLLNFKENTIWCSSADKFNYLNKLIYELYEEPILDKEEKKYLENVLRPFKDRVYCIRKEVCYVDDLEFLRFEFSELNGVNDDFFLPFFKTDTMYKGMERNKDYTLKELGLFENDR